MAQRKTKKTPAAKTKRNASARRRSARMPFERRNYVLLLAAIGLVVAGYAVMLVDNAVSDNPVDSPLSLTLAPLLLLGGYLGVIWAILAGLGGPEVTAETVPAAEPAEA